MGGASWALQVMEFYLKLQRDWAPADLEAALGSPLLRETEKMLVAFGVGSDRSAKSAATHELKKEASASEAARP